MTTYVAVPFGTTTGRVFIDRADNQVVTLVDGLVAYDSGWISDNPPINAAFDFSIPARGFVDVVFAGANGGVNSSDPYEFRARINIGGKTVASPGSSAINSPPGIRWTEAYRFYQCALLGPTPGYPTFGWDTNLHHRIVPVAKETAGQRTYRCCVALSDGGDNFRYVDGAFLIKEKNGEFAFATCNLFRRAPKGSSAADLPAITPPDFYQAISLLHVRIDEYDDVPHISLRFDNPLRQRLEKDEVFADVTLIYSVAKRYEVRPGDTLRSIAKKLLGDAERWRRIYDLNRAAIGNDPDRINPGQVLKIPN
ncbi:LysM peptidoglycan-binding domain-containing protein [Bradyrhizobium sp.]|uniref:LysM peptidoglycan-binding domain-containing protein n=1 Tax=Bradyrhizobium sp. TaxID=376 RepID=UPI001D239D66|nr:LysM peptidoglycan-binding domain-containing protein [Bradyrhizobium sp.]MBI5319445.1 LysM peptidoglycan-binding domain-containing protein [Bradyrhizobium sp.]